MANNPVPLMLLLTALGFLIGAAAGYFAFKYEARKAAQKPGEPEQLDQRTKYLVEQVELWRERAGSRLVIWFEGKPLNSPQSLDETHRQQLVSAGQEFLAWLGVKSTAVEMSQKPPVTDQQEILYPASASTTQTLAPAAMPVGSVESVQAVGPAKPLTIVEQIDEILQEMLKKDASLANRGIRLVEDPREGVVVWVGLEHFTGVDTVPHSEVKAVLRQAAAEWERRAERLRR
jgi:hypothetical protein